MRIVKYEILKILNKKPFILMIFIMFIANLVLYYGKETKYENMIINNKSTYYEMESKYKDMPKEEALNKLIKESDEVRDNEGFIVQSYFLDLLMEQFKYISSYDNYINSIEEKAEEMTSVSIFYDKDSFVYKNIIKTPKDFEHLKNIELNLGLSDGIKSSTDYFITDIFMLIIIIIMCIYLFLTEKESGLNTLIKSNKKGRLNVIGSKLITLIVGITVIALIFYSSILILGYVLYGFPDGSIYIQSLKDFREGNILITVNQYIIVYLCSKVITLTTIGLVLSLIFLLLRNTLEIYLTTFVFIILSYITYIFIQPVSYINSIKYINIFSFLNVYKMISEYININILGYPINIKIIYIAVSLVLVITLIILNIIIFSRSKKLSKESIIEIFINDIKLKLFKLRGRSNLFFQELYKIIVYNKVYIVLILTAIILGNNLISNEKLFNTNEIIYKNYISELSGETSEEKTDFINNEKKKFEELNNEYEKIDSMEISDKEKNNERNKLSILKSKEIIFEDIVSQHDYLTRLKEEKGISGSYIDMISYNEIFNKDKSNVVEGIIISILLIICLSNVLSMDFKNNGVKIIGCTKYGSNRALIYKYIISFIVIVSIFLLFTIFEYCKISNLYGLSNLNASIQSVPMYYEFPLEISIIQFIWIKELLKGLGLIVIGSVILFISVLVRSYSITMIISTSIIVVPLIINFMSVNFIDLISFNNIFILTERLSYKNGLVVTSIYYVVLIVLCLICSYLTFEKYKYNKDIKEIYYGIKNRKYK